MIKEQKDEIDAMKVSIKKSKDQNLALENELVAARKKIDDQQGEIAELYCLQYSTQESNLLKFVEFLTVSILPTKKLYWKSLKFNFFSFFYLVIKLVVEVLEVPMSPEDINISHKIKSKGVGSILVKFQSQEPS